MLTVDLIRKTKFFISLEWATSCICIEWILFLCRRTVKYILMYTTNVTMKLKAATTDSMRSRVLSNPHDAIEETNALHNHLVITTTTTRLWVTSSWYLRWRWTAKNLSCPDCPVATTWPEKSVYGLAKQTNSDFRAGKTQQQSFQSFCHSRSFVDGVDCHNIQHDGGVSHKIVKNAVGDKSRTKIFKFSVYGKIIQRLVTK